MFRSKSRDLIFPQSEHLRLAGALVLHWGNARFDRPDMDFAAYLTGAALHDWGHGFFDTNAIGAMDAEERWVSLTNLVQASLPDSVAETVMQHHVLRLIGDDPALADLRQTLLGRIDGNIRSLGAPRDAFRWADRITQLSDLISFDFCFDTPVQRTVPVCAHQHDPAHTEITYAVHEGGLITLDPWPLKVDCMEGYLLAYAAERYPQHLEPQVITYRVQPASA